MGPSHYPVRFRDSETSIVDVRADYILRHHRRESVARVDPDNLLQPNPTQSETRRKVITGSIIMLIGVLVGFALARSTPNDI